MTKNGVTQYQIKERTSDVSSLKSDMKLILENHLPHLKEEMATLSTNLNVKMSDLSGRMTVFTGINVGAVILGVIATKWLR